MNFSYKLEDNIALFNFEQARTEIAKALEIRPSALTYTAFEAYSRMDGKQKAEYQELSSGLSFLKDMGIMSDKTHETILTGSLENIAITKDTNEYIAQLKDAASLTAFADIPVISNNCVKDISLISQSQYLILESILSEKVSPKQLSDRVRVEKVMLEAVYVGTKKAELAEQGVRKENIESEMNRQREAYEKFSKDIFADFEELVRSMDL
ncbi:MAG: hypothetical protein Q8O89_07650 [Nanoarchaeota archaeon]|nr:hypothetical protein [Nanoarchaeota archaeon]